LIDLAEGQLRLGGSIYDQTQKQLSATCPDVTNVNSFKNFISAMGELKKAKIILAYHDKSDGGIWATLCEMAFASQCGLIIENKDQKISLPWLVNEELGVVVQVADDNLNQFYRILDKYSLGDIAS
jgi:phosphoribosylformylglycinamidine synthase